MFATAIAAARSFAPAVPPLPKPITAQPVPAPRRLMFLPTAFGLRRMIRGEVVTHHWLKQHSTLDPRSCAWEFYELSNGGFYLAPLTQARVRMQVGDGHFSGKVSGDAAGIIATLFTYDGLAKEAGADTREADMLVDRYYLLRDYAETHREATFILRAVE